MAKIDGTIALVGIGALALFMFREDVSATLRPASQVTGAVGGAFQTTGQRFKEVTSPTEIVQTSSDVIRETIIRETAESGERSRLKQERDLARQEARNARNALRDIGKTEREVIEQTQKTDREKIREVFKTDVTKGIIGAGRDISQTFKSKFRPTKEVALQRRRKAKEKLSSLKTKIFGKKIFGRG